MKCAGSASCLLRPTTGVTVPRTPPTPTTSFNDGFNVPAAEISRPSSTRCIHSSFKYRERHPWYPTSSSCLWICRGDDSELEVASALRELADVNRFLGPKEGIKQSSEALGIYEQTNDTEGQMICLNDLARSLYYDGQLDAAPRAIGLVPEKGQEYLVCRLQHHLGILFFFSDRGLSRFSKQLDGAWSAVDRTP